MPLSIAQIQHALWLTLAAVWLIGALRAKPSVRSQGRVTRLIHLGALVLAATLLFQSYMSIGPLGWVVVPRNEAIEWVGLAMSAAGIAFAIWARLFLGGNWSATVTLKESHTLVRGGPYAVVRHPIYTGCLLAMLGTAITTGELRGFLGFAIALVTWWVKSHVEEEFLTRQFGGAYAVYQREVKALIPYVL